jgi:hypothetical protein
VESSKPVAYESIVNLHVAQEIKKKLEGHQGTSSGLTECTLIVKDFFQIFSIKLQFFKVKKK